VSLKSLKFLAACTLATVVICDARTIIVKPGDSISKAADLAQPGDAVRILAGTYRESVHLHQSGTPAAPIRFIADEPGKVIVTGADPISHFDRIPGEEPIYSTGWTHVFAIDHRDGKPIEHHPDSAPLYGRAEQVIADDHLLLPCADLAELRQAWRHREKSLLSPVKNLGGPFAGMFFADTANHLLYLWLADGSDPNAHAMQASTRPQLFGVNEFESATGVHGVQVSGLVFRYAANFPQRAAVALHGSGNLLEHCLVEKMSGTGVSVAGTMKRCLIRDNGFCGGAVEGDHFRVEQCVWENNCWKPIDRNWEAGGAKICDSRSGVFKDCIFFRNGGPGLWLDIDCRSIGIEDCAFVENELSGLFIEISDSIRAEHNYVTGNAAGVVGQVTDAAWSCGGIQIAESDGCVIRHNLCIGNRDGITLRETGPRIVKTRKEERTCHTANLTITDNTIANSQKYDLALWWDNEFFGPHPSQKAPSNSPSYDPSKQNLQIDDDHYGSQPRFLFGAPWRNKSSKISSLEDWVKTTGFEESAGSSNEMVPPPFSVEQRINAYAPFTAP